MRKTIIGCFALWAIFSCKNETSNSETLKESVSFTKEGTLQISRGDSLILENLDIEIANTNFETETGLMYRESMGTNQGMLFIFEEVRPRSFYMKNTQFPLDIIYIAQDSSIVNIVKDAKPWNENSLPSEGPIKFVLEVNAGKSNELKLEAGDKVAWQKTSH